MVVKTEPPTAVNSRATKYGHHRCPRFSAWCPWPCSEAMVRWYRHHCLLLLSIFCFLSFFLLSFFLLRLLFLLCSPARASRITTVVRWFLHLWPLSYPLHHHISSSGQTGCVYVAGILWSWTQISGSLCCDGVFAHTEWPSFTLAYERFGKFTLQQGSVDRHSWVCHPLSSTPGQLCVRPESDNKLNVDSAVLLWQCPQRTTHSSMIYTPLLYKHIHTHDHSCKYAYKSAYLCMYTHRHTYTYTHVIPWIHIYVLTCKWIYRHTWVHITYIHTHVFMNIYLYTDAGAYIYMYTNIHTHTYKHAHTYICKLMYGTCILLYTQTHMYTYIIQHISCNILVYIHRNIQICMHKVEQRFCQRDRVVWSGITSSVVVGSTI